MFGGRKDAEIARLRARLKAALEACGTAEGRATTCRHQYRQLFDFHAEFAKQVQDDMRSLFGTLAKMQEGGKSLPAGADDEVWRRYRTSDFEKDDPGAKIYREYEPPEEYPLTEEEEATWNNG